MLFNSPAFLFVFLPLAWLGYRIAAGRSAFAIVAWMLAVSLLFYGIDNLRFLPVFLGSVALNYGVGLLLAARRDRSRQGLLLGLGVAANLALLGVFKYLGFAAEVLKDASGRDLGLPAIVLPIGISFYTFQQIAYIVDVRRGAAPERNPLRYMLFVSFFPHLIAGPMVYRHELLPQLDHPNRDFLRNVATGLPLLVIGLCKKVLVADAIAVPSSHIFGAVAAGAEPGLGDAWLAALSYSFQIYFDFSAYSDMAIGLGRMFGLEIPINFASPYKARSIVDFWRRWHITLSRFLRDYLYVSLGGSRHGAARRYANLMLTMLLGGLWHGAGWPFIAWGGLHGGYLWLNHLWRASPWAPRLAPSRSWGLAAQAITFLAVVIAWVPFRAHDFATAARIWSGMAGRNGLAPRLPVEVAGTYWWLVLALAAAAWLLPNSHEVMAGTGLGTPSRAYPATEIKPPRRLVWRPSLAWAIPLGGGLAFCLLKLNDVSEFLYFRF